MKSFYLFLSGCLVATGAFGSPLVPEAPALVEGVSVAAPQESFQDEWKEEEVLANYCYDPEYDDEDDDPYLSDSLVRVLVGADRQGRALARRLLLTLPPAPGEESPLPLTLDLDRQKEILTNRFRLIPTHKEAYDIYYRCYTEAMKDVRAAEDKEENLKWRNFFLKHAVVSLSIAALMGASHYYNWPGAQEREFLSWEKTFWGSGPLSFLRSGSKNFRARTQTFLSRARSLGYDPMDAERRNLGRSNSQYCSEYDSWRGGSHPWRQLTQYPIHFLRPIIGLGAAGWGIVTLLDAISLTLREKPLPRWAASALLCVLGGGVDIWRGRHKR